MLKKLKMILEELLIANNYNNLYADGKNYPCVMTRIYS